MWGIIAQDSQQLMVSYETQDEAEHVWLNQYGLGYYTHNLEKPWLVDKVVIEYDNYTGQITVNKIDVDKALYELAFVGHKVCCIHVVDPAKKYHIYDSIGLLIAMDVPYESELVKKALHPDTEWLLVEVAS